MNFWELKILWICSTLLPVSTTELLWGLQEQRKWLQKAPCAQPALLLRDMITRVWAPVSWKPEVCPAAIPMAEPVRHRKPPASNIFPTVHKSMFCPDLLSPFPALKGWSEAIYAEAWELLFGLMRQTTLQTTVCYGFALPWPAGLDGGPCGRLNRTGLLLFTWRYSWDLQTSMLTFNDLEISARYELHEDKDIRGWQTSSFWWLWAWI